MVQLPWGGKLEIPIEMLNIDTNLIIISILKIYLTDMFAQMPKIYYKMFIIVMFVMAKMGKNLNAHQ